MSKHGDGGEASVFDYGIDDKDLKISHHPNHKRQRHHSARESAGHDSNPRAARPHVGHSDVHKQHNATMDGKRKQSIYGGSTIGGSGR